MRKYKRFLFVAAGLFGVYVTTYHSLSRRGYAGADRHNMIGFYFFFPEDSDAWRFKNYGCVILFWPLNALDRALGSGRPPASEPLWGLSR